MRQDFWNISDDADGDDLDRLFSHLAENEPTPGRAFDDTLANLRNWQGDPPRRRPHLARLATIVVMLVWVGGWAWLTLAPHSDGSQVVADSSVFDTSIQTTVPAEASPVVANGLLSPSVVPTVKTLHPPTVSSFDPVLARLTRLNEHEQAMGQVSSDDDGFLNAFKSHFTPSPV